MARAGSGKAKGAEFERSVCKRLSLWVTDGERTDVFWRSAMSGGRATVARNKGEHVRQSGDITAVASEGHALTDKLYFELKFYKDLELTSFFVKHSGILVRFWNKTINEADRYEKTPILIAKQNRLPALFLTTSEWFIHIKSPAEVVATVPFASNFCMVYVLDDILKNGYKTSGTRIKAS